MKFNGSLRDYQIDIVNTYMSSTKDGGGLLEIPCGRGNRNGIENSSRTRSKNISYCRKTFLTDQWIERINNLYQMQGLVGYKDKL